MTEQPPAQFAVDWEAPKDPWLVRMIPVSDRAVTITYLALGGFLLAIAALDFVNGDIETGLIQLIFALSWAILALVRYMWIKIGWRRGRREVLNALEDALTNDPEKMMPLDVFLLIEWAKTLGVPVDVERRIKRLDNDR